MTTCPCCSNSMLRHVRHQQVYWFCRSCWQEMPLIKHPHAMLVSTSPQQRMTLGIRRPLVNI